VNARDVVTRDGLPAVYAKDRATWRRWLSGNHLRLKGVWLVYYKRGSGRPTVSYAEAVEECLCFGWIDSLVNPVDADRYMQLMTPRKAKSAWSKINKGRIERMIAEGRMTEAGLEKIERAKRDGSWEALDRIEAGEMPAELRRALNTNGAAKKTFQTWAPSRRKQVLYWTSNAKRAETRQRRAERAVELIAQGIRPGDAGWRT
jgi:uncharacterized protein YdeI (YjbR/CyaY-like superfamily)